MPPIRDAGARRIFQPTPPLKSQAQAPASQAKPQASPPLEGAQEPETIDLEARDSFLPSVEKTSAQSPHRPEAQADALPNAEEPELTEVRRLSQAAEAPPSRRLGVRLTRESLHAQLDQSVQNAQLDEITREIYSIGRSLVKALQNQASATPTPETPKAETSSSELQSEAPSTQAPSKSALTRSDLSQRLEALTRGSIRSFASLDEALQYANQNTRGSEAVVRIQGEDGETRFAVVPLKKGSTAEAVQKALGEPLPQVLLTQDDGRVQPLKPAQESPAQSAERTLALAQVALRDKARGFDRNQAGNQAQNRGIAYQKNLLMVMGEIHGAQSALRSEKQDLEQRLHGLKQKGQGDSPQADSLRQELKRVSGQLRQLRSAAQILEARLSQRPKASRDIEKLPEIPGSELRVGQNRSQPQVIIERLEQAVREIDRELLVTQDPQRRTALLTQKTDLQQEISQVSRRNLEIQEAELKYRVRMGALATMHTELKDSQARIQDLQKELPDAQTQRGKDEIQVGQLDNASQRFALNQERKALIGKLEAQLKVYKEHAAMGKKGPQLAVKLLQAQIDKLKAMDPSHLNPERLLAEIEKTQQILTGSLTQAGDIFDGVRPDEVKAIQNLEKTADGLVKDYRAASQKLKNLSRDLSTRLNNYQEGVKQLKEAQGATPTGHARRRQLSQFEKAYFSAIQTRLKEADPAKAPKALNADLKKLHQLYAALQMANDPNTPADLRARIDVAAIQRQIKEIGAKPEVQAVFQAARDEAVKKVYGGTEATERMAAEILSPAFQEQLQALPKEQAGQLLALKLKELGALNPAKAKEVQAQLFNQTMKQQSVAILSSLPAAQRKQAFAQVFAKIATGNVATGVDKSAKVADAFAKVFESLSPEETQKLQNYLKLMETDPNARQKLYAFLSERLEKVAPDGTRGKALAQLDSLNKSGKLGAFMTLVAAVATAGKLPDALEKQDFKSIVNLTSSAFSVAGGLKGVADMYDISKGAKVLKAMEFLGPIGDVLGAGLDAYGSYEDYQKGDYVGAGAKGVGAAAGLTGAGAGVLILAGVSGPGAPLVLAGATVVGLAAWGVDVAFAESDMESDLRNLGVLKPKRPAEERMQEQLDSYSQSAPVIGF